MSSRAQSRDLIPNIYERYSVWGISFFIHLVQFSRKNVPDTPKLEGIWSILPPKLHQMETFTRRIVTKTAIIGSKEKASWKVLGVKHKKVEQALGRSLRNLFEQLAWRTSPAAVLWLTTSSVILKPLSRLILSLYGSIADHPAQRLGSKAMRQLAWWHEGCGKWNWNWSASILY